MKKKFALVTATAITVLLLFVGCGVKVTNISGKMGTVPKLRS